MPKDIKSGKELLAALDNLAVQGLYTYIYFNGHFRGTAAHPTASPEQIEEEFQKLFQLEHQYEEQRLKLLREGYNFAST
jgi:hypothetical protein